MKKKIKQQRLQYTGTDYKIEYVISEPRVKVNDYLETIGGLVNGYYTDRPPIMEIYGVCDGWMPMILDLIKELVADGWNRQICDIKEKFGGLRFYTNGCTSDNHYDIISKYEKLSYTICEECGEPGEPRHTGWIKTLCEKHHDERQKK